MLDGMSSYNQADLSARLQQADAQLNRLQNQFQNPKTEDQEKMKKAAQEFEAIFFKQLLDEMDKTVDRTDSLLGGGPGEEMFRGMMNEQVANRLTSRVGGSGLGLAEIIYQQMSQAAQGPTSTIGKEA